MKIKTRDRILDASLGLFNAVGEPNVTTLLISDELDISPGNLYYHFKSKGDIVSEIFGAFEHELVDLLSVPKDAEVSLDQLGFLLHLMFETIARYRFIYQDLVNILSRYETLQKHFQKLLRKKEEAFRTLCESLRRQGALEITPQELDALCEQLTLTICYWLSYDSLAQLGDRNSVNPGRGVYQMMNLLAPYLGEEERLQILALGETYL